MSFEQTPEAIFKQQCRSRLGPENKSPSELLHQDPVQLVTDVRHTFTWLNNNPHGFWKVCLATGSLVSLQSSFYKEFECKTDCVP